ncbi:MAG: peptide deformylase [Bacteroidia bacterium]|jgi:peptide deformylase|nr:peptide deformylase [Bacteroidia bacterium]GIV24153.1 MAG: peptide deformylase [Bacteroidia bacterium]
MIRPILLYGSPILRKEAQLVDVNDPTLPQLIQDLWDTMYNAEGVGLAAPQIGVSLQVFVVDAAPLQPPDEPPFKGIFINPQIIGSSPTCVPHEEGCLSIPGLREKIYRPDSIEVFYYDENGQPVQARFAGIVARIIQHEYDHLLGRLFIDYLSPIKKQLIRARLREIQQGLIEVQYPTL